MPYWVLTNHFLVIIEIGNPSNPNFGKKNSGNILHYKDYFKPNSISSGPFLWILQVFFAKKLACLCLKKKRLSFFGIYSIDLTFFLFFEKNFLKNPKNPGFLQKTHPPGHILWKTHKKPDRVGFFKKPAGFFQPCLDWLLVWSPDTWMRWESAGEWVSASL